MARILGSVVKIMNQELEGDNILLQCFNALASFIFIEFSYSSLSTKLSKGIFQSDAFLSSKPSTLMGSIESVVSCLCSMVLPRQTSNKLQTLDYDKIPL
jgi:hypothetical protein